MRWINLIVQSWKMSLTIHRRFWKGCIKSSISERTIHFVQSFFIKTLTKSVKLVLITFFNILFRTIRGRHFAVTPRQVWTDKSTLKMTTIWPQETWSWHNKGDKSKGQFPYVVLLFSFKYLCCFFLFDLKVIKFVSLLKNETVNL